MCIIYTSTPKDTPGFSTRAPSREYSPLEPLSWRCPLQGIGDEPTAGYQPSSFGHVQMEGVEPSTSVFETDGVAN